GHLLAGERAVELAAEHDRPEAAEADADVGDEADRAAHVVEPPAEVVDPGDAEREPARELDRRRPAGGAEPVAAGEADVTPDVLAVAGDDAALGAERHPGVLELPAR